MINVWNLKPGSAIRIVKTFQDYHGKEFAEGTNLHVIRRDYLPYHNGHTIFFQEATMYLCDNDDTSAIVRNEADEYFILTEEPV